MAQSWHKLDNMGTFYSLTNKVIVPAVFRFSVTLSEDIDEEVLNIAIREATKLYPIFKSHLRVGMFWYYLETSDKEVKCTKEETPICERLYYDSTSDLFRVNYYHNRINLEVSHIISDGRGSLTFFKCLIYKYLIIKYDLKDIDIEDDSSIFEKAEDSFDKHYESNSEKKANDSKGKIYHFSSKTKNNTTYMEYHISTSKVLELAHKYNTSLTGLILSVLVMSFKNEMKDRELKDKCIKINVPVDLRKYYNSKTSGNFFGLASISYKFKSRNDTFEEVVESVNRELKEKLKIGNLQARMNLMISIEKNAILRFISIFIKDFILKVVDLMGDSNATTTVSNIGVIEVDPRLEKYIKGFNVFNTTGSMKFIVSSYKDDLSITISSKYRNNDVIKNFCRYFGDNGIEGVLNTTKEDKYEEM
jgi:hypothetical protein